MTLDPNNVRVLLRELIDDEGPRGEMWVTRFTRAITDDEALHLMLDRLGPPIGSSVEEAATHFENLAAMLRDGITE